MREGALFVLGIVLLTLGADWLVRGASNLAERLGISSLVVGLTVVAFGTSAPELVVSAAASLNGEPEIAVGNVMGSTAANVGLIVGLGALIRPISVHRSLVVRETPLVIAVLSLVMILSLNDALGRLDGLLLVTGFVGYLVFLLKWQDGGLRQLTGTYGLADAGTAAAEGGKDGEHEPGRDEPAMPNLAWAIGRIAIGLPCLIFGARWLLDAARAIAVAFDVPEAVIAATMIAVGTSLPELASTLAAAIRGMGDIAIGSVIGSNVFNLGLVLGTAALLAPLQMSPALVVKQVLPALAFSVLLIPLALTQERVDRWEAALLLTGYIGFIVWIL